MIFMIGYVEEIFILSFLLSRWKLLCCHLMVVSLTTSSLSFFVELLVVWLSFPFEYLPETMKIIMLKDNSMVF